MRGCGERWFATRDGLRGVPPADWLLGALRGERTGSA
jgi:hypothetical protein